MGGLNLGPLPDMFDSFRHTSLLWPSPQEYDYQRSTITEEKSMNTDEIVIELGLVSEKTLGVIGTVCEWYCCDLEPANITDPGWFQCS